MDTELDAVAPAPARRDKTHSARAAPFMRANRASQGWVGWGRGSGEREGKWRSRTPPGRERERERERQGELLMNENGARFSAPSAIPVRRAGQGIYNRGFATNIPPSLG